MGTTLHQGWSTNWTTATNPASWPAEKNFEKSKQTKSNSEVVFVLDQANSKMQVPIHPLQIQKNNVQWSRNWDAPTPTTFTPIKSKTHKKMNSLDELTQEIDSLVLATTTLPSMLQGEDEDSINASIVQTKFQQPHQIIPPGHQQPAQGILTGTNTPITSKYHPAGIQERSTPNYPIIPFAGFCFLLLHSSRFSSTYVLQLHRLRNKKSERSSSVLYYTLFIY